jgi:tetratricopeptide (TPR) repeat protein
MNRSRVAFYVVALFVVELILNSLVFAGEPQWLEVRSPHFSVVTDAGEKRGREVALRFEQMRAVYGALLVKSNVNLAVPLQIVAFRNTKEMRQFAPLWNGKPTEVAGLFQGGEDRSFIMLDMSSENPWQVVFHEYAHQLMNGNVRERMDPWFEEGFAEYFSSIEVDNKQARVGKVRDEEYQILRQVGFIKIADLFQVQQNSSTYNESGGRRTVFYAESSLVVHYLYDHQLIPKLGEYFTLKVDRKVPVEDAMKQAFGMDAQRFDKELRNYVGAGRYRYYALPTPQVVANANYSVTPVSVADSSAVLGDIHLHSPDYLGKAVEEFEAILKTDPNHAASLRGLGYAYLQKHDFQRAGEYFRRSAQADSKDPRVHYYSALLMNQEGRFEADPEKIAVMKKELQASISLDPNFADAYNLLAFADMSSGDHDKALQDMEKALSINPRNEGYQINLAIMYMSARKLDQASSLLKDLVNSPIPGLAMRAEELLRNLGEMRTVGAMGAGNDAGIVHRVPAEHPADPQEQGEAAAQGQVHLIAVAAPPRFLKGKLVKVDCSAPPAAVLTVTSAAKTWKMKVADTRAAVVIGADSFSCAWSNQTVALNFHETGDGEGTVMSVEIQ